MITTPNRGQKVMDAVFKEIMSDSNALLEATFPIPAIPKVRPIVSLNSDMSAATPEEILKRVREAKKHRAQAEVIRREREKLELDKLLSKEDLFRFAYVPFVIAELVWDYADTVMDMAAWLKLRETRHLGRRIKELRREYKRVHDTFIDQEHNESEINNMYVYEDEVKHIFHTYYINLQCDLRHEYPDLSDDSISYLVAIYQCHVTLQALLLYTKRQEERLAKIVGHPVGHFLPPSVYELSKLILEYTSDCPAPEKFNKLQDTYIKTFATQMGLIELNDISNES
ncbi:MAG: hypothetical protein NC548_36095 [Lachnospiraceae bacterium]|nr:hypothetical protein [Lachnospiraceae bacterium]